MYSLFSFGIFCFFFLIIAEWNGYDTFTHVGGYVRSVGQKVCFFTQIVPTVCKAKFYSNHLFNSYLSFYSKVYGS